MLVRPLRGCGGGGDCFYPQVARLQRDHAAVTICATSLRSFAFKMKLSKQIIRQEMKLSKQIIRQKMKFSKEIICRKMKLSKEIIL